MAITAKMVRELREMTGAAMMKCKEALEASGGDLEAATDYLRKAGLKSAAKKASRETAEGRVFAVTADGGRRAHLVAVACETDFLSGSDKFKDFVGRIEEAVSSTDPDGIDAGERPLLTREIAGHADVAACITDAVAQFGENVQVKELARLENPEGQVGTYIHHDNKQGAIVSVTTGADAAKAEEVLRALCQHIVVFQPAYGVREDVPQDALDRERAIIAEADDMKKKPAEVRDKIVEGRLSKFYATCVLTEQPWILDDKISVQKALDQALGGEARLQAFRFVKLG